MRMRWSGRRTWLALGTSLGAHALLVLFAAQLCRWLREDAPAAEGFVDRRIEGPDRYPPLAITFDDSPAPSPKQAATPVKPPEPPALAKDDPPPAANANTNMNPAPSWPNENGSTNTGSRIGPAPLHGKITRAGLSIVYVLDRSGSMGRDRKLALAVGVLKASLRQLGPDVLFQIVTYDSRARPLRLGRGLEPAPATPENIASAEEQLDDLAGEGSSRHVEGLRAGLELRPDVLILLTDADELTVQDVKQVKKWNARGTAIHAVLLGAAGGESLCELAGPERVHHIPLPERVALRP
jgi:hypothetical protein